MSDITERSHNEQRLHQVIEHAPNGMVMVDRDGKIVLVNAQMEKSFGYSREELLGQPIELLVPKRFHGGNEAYREEFTAALGVRSMVAGFDLYGLHKDGSEFPVEVGLNPIESDQGVLVLGTIVDITERKRGEEKLRKSQEQLARVIGSAMDAIITVDSDQRIVLFNEAAETMFQCTADQAMGSMLKRFMPDRFRAGHHEDVEKFGQTNITNGSRGALGAIFGLRADGEEFPIEASISQVESQGQKFYTFILRDITDRRRTEEALKDSEEEYRQLFESNPDPTFVFDQETLRFLAFNEAAVQQYGYSREELLSLTSKDIWSPDEIAAFDKLLAKLPRVPPPEATWKHQKKDGTAIDVEITHRPLLFADRPAWMMIAHNVTDRRIMEEQLLQSQKMEAVGQLAGGMAHDFNNLLTVINGYSDLAMGRLETGDPLRHDMEQIKQAGERAAELTRQLLAFSRKQVLLPTILDLNAVISDMEKMFHRLIGEDILLRTDLAPKAGLIKADRGQIEQVIMNLVVNARDAMPSGGKLTIETQNIDLTEDCAPQGAEPGPCTILAVTDTGVGMDARTQARIFEPFFTTKEVGKGTGLGLSTVYGIVQQSGGSIQVYSEVGRGTSFKVCLPRVGDDRRLYPRSILQAEMARGTETVLLTEDDAGVRGLAGRVLSTQGYRVLEAANGDEAISIFERHVEPIHLLITDVVMPGMSGRDLVDRAAKLRPETRVLYMSGYTDKAIVHQQVLDEKTPFIQKPFAPQAFANKVREVLDKAS